MNDLEENNIELSLIIPGFNEGDIIENNLRKIIAHLNQNNFSSWEIIFINDGSTDNTLESLKDLKTSESKFSIISYKTNKGRGYALRRGFEEAKGKYILTAESDMNYGLGIVINLYNSIADSNSDIVVASPYMNGGRLINVPLFRAFLSRYGNKILSLSIGGVVNTVSGMVRIYKKECIKSLPLVSDDKEIHLEIISKALTLGYKIDQIPAILEWPKKDTGKKLKRKSKFKFKKYIFSHLIFSFFEKPFFIFGILGLLVLAIGSTSAFYLLSDFFKGDLNPERPLMTAVVVMLIGGFNLISFGLLGLQINDLRSEIYRLQKNLKILYKEKDY
tara:strand:+ start:707 stop:1702 length:996 start_codon:yes stop_codon:yes gene_type:complete